MQAKVTIHKKDRVIVIEIPMENPGTLTKNEKSFLLASTRGTQWTDEKFDDMTVKVAVNVTTTR